MSSAFDDLFGSAPVPAWLLAFEADSSKAVDDLLWGRFYLGHLNVADPEDLLVDWALMIGDHAGFAQTLDETLSMWVRSHWGRPPSDFQTQSPRRLAVAWIRLLDVVAYLGNLSATAAKLRGFFDDRESYLAPLSPARSHDPLGRYLHAVAQYQEDRALAPTWWRLCDLPPDVPFYHGIYGIGGLRGMPPADESEKGGFRTDVAHGLLRFGQALDDSVAAGLLREPLAANELRHTATLTVAAYPFPDRWKATYWDMAGQLPERCRAWLSGAIPGIKPGSAGVRRSGRTRFAPRPDWATRAQQLAVAFKKDAEHPLVEARALLAEQCQYAETSGDSSFLVRSLTSFTKAVWQNLPAQSVRWAEEAYNWEPWNAYCHTTLTHSLTLQGETGSALPLAWDGVERFPENAYAWTELGEALKTARNLNAAEQVYRDARLRFPGNDAIWTGFAEVLKKAGRLADAENAYREARDQCPKSEYAWNGLADVLKLRWNLPAAEEVYRASVERFDDRVARIGLASVLRLRGPEHLAEARQHVEYVLSKRPNEPDALQELGFILEAERSMGEAGRAFESATDTVMAAAERRRADSLGQLGWAPVRWFPTDAAAELHLRRRERAVIASQARFLRRWARQHDLTGAPPSPDELRRQAEELLDLVLQSCRHDLRALTEKVLLLIDGGRLAEARSLVDEAPRHLRAMPSLNYALARLEREQAVEEQRAFDDRAFQVLVQPLHAIRAANKAFHPFVRLGEARACLALSDGSLLRERGLEAVNHLRDWLVTPHAAATDFDLWWSDEVASAVFGAQPSRLATPVVDLGPVAEQTTRNSRQINTLEEDFVNRLALRAS